MKFNFRKISAVLASGLMTVSGAAFAAAANFPAPFVVGGSADAAVVYGTGSGALDMTPATSVSNYLASKMTVSSGEIEGGDYVLIEGTSDKFNLGDEVIDFYTSLDDGELGTVLAEGTYTSDSNDDYDYSQNIRLFTGLTLTHFQDDNFNDEKPLIGFDISRNTVLMNYTLDFDDAVDGGTEWEYITGSYIPILGQEYYVLDMTNTSGTNHKITLLNSAVSGSLAEGESITLSDGTMSYDVSVQYIDDDEVKLIINGETTDSLNEAETYKLSSGSYVGIKEISYQGVSGGASNVDFSIGSGKLELENGQEVEINGEALSDEEYDVINSDGKTVSYVITAHINTDGEDLESFVLEWKLDDNSWIAPGTEMVLPGFESIKYYMSDFVIPGEEITTIKGDSNTLTISTTLEDGDIDLDILYINSSSTGIEGIGADDDNELYTGTAAASATSTTGILVPLNDTLGTYFVTTWVSGDEAETHVYEYKSTDDSTASKNTTIIKNMIDNSEMSLDIGETETEGNVDFELVSAAENYDGDGYEYAVVNITSATSGGTVYIDRIVTAEGMMIELPVDDVATAAAVTNNYLNLTAGHPTSMYLNVTEEDDDDNIATGGSFVLNIGFTGTDGIRVGSLTDGAGTQYETEDDSDLYVGYLVSSLATKTELDKSTDLYTLDIYYPGEESYAEVYIAETGVSSTGSTGSMLFKDSEKSSWESKNVIVVGGSCINSAAATLLGGALCETAFTDATGVGAGQYLVESFGDGFSSGKIALLVAGYNAADTVAAASRLIEPGADVDTTAGTKYIGTVGTTGGSTMSKVE